MPLVKEVFRQILLVGAHPQLIVHHHRTEELARDFFEFSGDSQLNYVDPQVLALGDRFDSAVHILSEVNTKGLSRSDSAKMAIRAHAYQPMWDLIDDREASGHFKWVIACQPTTGYAQDAEMSLGEFEDFVYSACHVGSANPVEEWHKVGVDHGRAIELFAGVSQLAVKGPYVDVSFSIRDRSFINCDGHNNMPDGEIFTGPVEESVNGSFESTFPAISGGVDCGRVTLEFKDGRVVRAEAEKHSGHLNAILNTDEGARRLGEFGIGTNNHINVFSGSMLFDEKIGGTTHFAIGSGYPRTGSVNKSGIHWDFLVDMRDGGQILADGRLIYDSGKFLTV